MQRFLAVLMMSVAALLAGVLAPQQAFAVPPGPCADYVHIFSLTGQDPQAWQARVVGTDLQRLVKDASGHAFITIRDDDGDETLHIRWDDRGHPLNTVVTFNGLTPSVQVSILSENMRYTGCSQTFNLRYRAR